MTDPADQNRRTQGLHQSSAIAEAEETSVQLARSLVDLVRQVVREELGVQAPAITGVATDSSPPLGKATYTAAEVGQLFGLSRKAIFARAARGQLPGAFHLGRSLRFRGPELLRFMAEGRAPSPRGTRR